MNAADEVVVNSKFTKAVSKRVFPTLNRELGVIYPCVDTSSNTSDEHGKIWDGKFKILLSINRFEQKKDIGLALRAYARLSDEERKSTRLILAGGYDQRVAENVQYHKELERIAEESGLKHATAKTAPTALAVPDDIQVLFLLSVPESFKVFVALPQPI